MDAKDRQYLQHLVESDDGTFVDGDDVALNRDPRDPRIDQLGMRLKDLQAALHAAARTGHQFQKISEILVLLPEEDPRRLNGITSEIDIDIDVIMQACDRLQPRLQAALAMVGDDVVTKDDGWV